MFSPLTFFLSKFLADFLTFLYSFFLSAINRSE